MLAPRILIARTLLPRLLALRNTLRTRLVLAISLLALAFCALLLAIQIETTRRAVHEEVEAANRIATQLLSRVVQIAGAEGLPALRQFLEGTGRIRANDITIYNSANQVVYRSPPSMYKAHARAPDWFSALVLPRIEPRVVNIAGGRLVVESEASRAALDGWEDTRWLAGLSAAFILASALVVALVAGRQADRTESELHNSRAVHEWLQERIEDERKHLARELHDEVAQSVTAIKSIALALPSLPADQSKQAAAAIADGATELYDSMQAIVSRLRPLAIDSLGLSASLQDLVAQAQRAPGTPLIELQLTHADQVPKSLRLTVYRIAQEALTNAIRHSQARRISIKLSLHDQRLLLSIDDDGCGFKSVTSRRPHSGIQGGFGVRGMHERAETVGGKLWLSRSALGGASVCADLPLRAVAAALPPQASSSFES